MHRAPGVTLIIRKRAIRNPLINQYFGRFDPIEMFANMLSRLNRLSPEAAAQSIEDAGAMDARSRELHGVPALKSLLV